MAKVLLTTENVKAWREERDDLIARLKAIEDRLHAASFFLDESDDSEPNEGATNTIGAGVDKPDIPLVDAIVKVLERHGVAPMSNANIKEHLPEFGYQDGSVSPNYFYTATKRLSDKNRIVKLEDGRYVLPGSEAHKRNEPPKGGSETGEVGASSDMQKGTDQRIPSANSPDPSGQTRHWKMPGT